jgi:hypothetical protein
MTGIFDPHNVMILNMPSIFPQMKRNPIRTPKLRLNSRPNRVRLISPTRLPYRRHMINIHTEFKHNQGLGSGI